MAYEQDKAPMQAGHAPGAASRIVPVRHYGRWISAAVVLLLVAGYVNLLATNQNMRWDVTYAHLFHPAVMNGLWLTIQLTVASMVLAIVSGGILGLMRLSQNPVLRLVSWTAIWFLRGTPLLVQLLFWYFLASLFPVLSISIPFGPTLFSADTNTLIDQFGAAVLGLGLNEGAYMAEIYRAGILSVDKGQTEAAQSLGMTRARLMRRIIMPQAMRFIIPPTGNATISMLKTTSVVLIIGLPDLLTSVQLIYARNFQQIPLLAVACFWYLVCTTALTIVQSQLELRYARGAAAEARGGLPDFLRFGPFARPRPSATPEAR